MPASFRIQRTQKERETDKLDTFSSSRSKFNTYFTLFLFFFLLLFVLHLPAVHERTMDNQECPWEIIKNVARVITVANRPPVNFVTQTIFSPFFLFSPSLLLLFLPLFSSPTGVCSKKRKYSVLSTNQGRSLLF